jgi:hypothetical protein
LEPKKIDNVDDVVHGCAARRRSEEKINGKKKDPEFL